jgi:cob(I)alamin adenosyltransferase
MSKSRIYTRTGDEGQTGLVSGNRVSKGDSRIDLYGELDELNSRLGMVCSLLRREGSEELVDFLHEIQSALFDLGSNAACEADLRAQYKLPELKTQLIDKLERSMDEMDKGLPELKSFILPGGTLTASAIHLCRTCARAVERRMVAYQQDTGEDLPANGLRFLNRLSDYLFVLARKVNQLEGEDEILWKPAR